MKEDESLPFCCTPDIGVSAGSIPGREKFSKTGLLAIFTTPDLNTAHFFIESVRQFLSA